ncbi:MAG: response regulator transcription factor [Chloroflexi bacterium]|nr:response regulator transcription factor [Chloroflexota bacterium]
MGRRPRAGQTIKVLLADDQALARELLKPLLHQHGVEIIDQAFSCRELVQKSQELLPHIILLNASMPGTEADEVCQSILTQEPEAKVLAYFHPKEWRWLVSADGTEIAVSISTAEELIRTIRAMARGRFVARSVGPRMAFQAVPSADAGRTAELNDTQVNILELLAKGLSNRQIAEELGLQVQTIKNNLGTIFRELGVTNRTAAVMMALGLGFISLEPLENEPELPNS